MNFFRETALQFGVPAAFFERRVVIDDEDT